MKKDVKKISQEEKEEEEQNRYLEALQQQLDAEKEESPSSSTPVPSNQEDPLEAYRDTFLELSGELEAVTPTNPSEPTTFKRISDKDEATLIAGVAVELTKAPSPGKGGRRGGITSSSHSLKIDVCPLKMSQQHLQAVQ